MDEMKMYQEGQDAGGGQPQAATMPDMLAHMRQIFADRDAEYTRMEQAYQKRKESLDAKEASLQETLSGLEGRLLSVTKREGEVQKKETELQEEIQSLAIEKAALQEAQVKLEKEKTKQWMQVSLLREEARNEKLRSQRLAGEYEEKLSKLPADSPYLSDLQETAGQEARRQMEEKIAALSASLQEKEQEITGLRAENERLQGQNEYLTRANRELEELSQNLPEQQKKDMESLHALAKKLAEEKEALEEENRCLEEENQRLQEEKGGVGSQEESGLEKEERPESFRWAEEDISVSREEPEQADVLLEKEPMTAEALQEYLKESGADARLLHSGSGELVAVLADDLQIMFSFRELPQFDIHKKQKGGWGMKKLIKRYNENRAGLTFIYDEKEEELIGSAEFSLSISPEDLIHKVYQAARTYFGYRDKEEA